MVVHWVTILPANIARLVRYDRQTRPPRQGGSNCGAKKSQNFNKFVIENVLDTYS